jgi:hypothetical protein
MTTTAIHLAALFETTAAARAARDALIAAGVPAGSILVLDRGNPAMAANTATPRGLWGTLKHVLVPDDHAHPYAEGVSRGHPLVVADVSEAQCAAARAALKASHPINIEDRAEAWSEDGWEGVYEGQDEWLDAQPDRDAAGSEGITAGGIIAGDYGAVGAPHGARVDLDITRGQFRGPPREAKVLSDDPAVRVYKVEG